MKKLIKVDFKKSPIVKFLNTECPKCHCEDAFFNGVCYECPNCDYEWGGLR